MKKIISILIILMIMSMFIIPTKTNASFSIDSASLYSKGIFNDYISFRNESTFFNYVVYEKSGKEYPAYCLNKDLDGVTPNFTYSVSTEELLTNVKVWRAIINGYPYKTAAELGCESNEEAFMATKQAVYCMLYNRDVSEYSAKDERQERVLNALTNIVTNAKNSSETKPSAELAINDITKNWEQDKINNKYISKTFTVSANAKVDTYKVTLENIKIEGAKIVDEQNEEKEEFRFNEKFKVLIPIINMEQDGQFNIKVEGQVATKPVLYGYSGSSSLQDYAITGSIYEDGEGEETINYTKNETKIIIKKQNDEGNHLEGVKFNLLNEKKEIVYLGLTTNENGEIIINNLEPGKYYVEETSTVSGYEVYEGLVEVNVTYNEEFTVTVTNSKEHIEIEKPKIIENEKEVVVKLPKTGM